MTEKILSQAQAADMGFLRRVHDVTVTLRDNVRQLWNSQNPGWSDYITDLAWSRLGVEPAKLQYVKLLLTVRYSKSS